MMEAPGCFIGGKWVRGGGEVLTRQDPAAGRVSWQGPAASKEQVARAAEAAGSSLEAWMALSAEERSRYLDAFGAALTRHGDELLEAICLETGKPRWESRTELEALHRKIELTRQAHAQRMSPLVNKGKDGVTSAIRYRPLGVVAVLGPFNLPAHLPNGQILPALLAGNTVVFKPSEMTPGVGEIYTRCWEEAGLPAGVFNMIQGGREQGAVLAAHAGVSGVFFTGSRAGGCALSMSLAARPEKLLALEMGGNNPLIATGVSDADAAAYSMIQSAFITAGQRCTCARRLILLQDKEGDRLLERLVSFSRRLVVGPYTASPEPFMGPVISPAAGERLFHAYDALIRQGGAAVLPLSSMGGRVNMLSPGILDVTGVRERGDEEFFGPMLQVIRVPDVEAALAEANRTEFGLAAGLLSDDGGLFERFYRRVRAGIVNWNRPTTGASGTMPFGGVGASGNHRPAGFFAVDFCADPVASLEAPALTMPATLSPGILPP